MQLYSNGAYFCPSGALSICRTSVLSAKNRPVTSKLSNNLHEENFIFDILNKFSYYEIISVILVKLEVCENWL